MMKKLFSLLFTVLLAVILTTSALAGSPKVVRSTQALSVDGKAVTCDKYNIDGSNYFKLRDLAAALNGTGSQFAIGFDGKTNAITLTTGKAYQPIGGELTMAADRSSTAVPSKQNLFVDGVSESGLSVYNIGGSNYFKLRDLGSIAGFFVRYDEETKMMQIESCPLDSRQNQAMSWQIGNCSESGAAVETDAAVYYLFRNDNKDPAAQLPTGMSIIERTDAGACRVVYGADARIDYLSADENGNIYFILNSEKIIRLNPETGGTETVYTFEKNLFPKYYFFYDGTLYVQDESQETNVVSRVSGLKAVSGTQTKTLVSVKYDDSTYFPGAYPYMGKIYYVVGDGTYPLVDSITGTYFSIYSYDLATGKTERVLFNCGEATFSGGYAYYRDYKTGTIKRVDLLHPENSEDIAVLSEEQSQSYPNLYVNGVSVFWQSSSGRGLWKMSQSGASVRLIKSPTVYYEGSVVTRQAVLDLPLPTMNFILSSDVCVKLPDGTSVSYADFLNVPDLVKALADR